MFGGIEAGGTKFVCAVGTGPEDLVTTRIPTRTPDETVSAAIQWLVQQSAGKLRAVGIGSFGPVDLKTGFITTTPKAEWRQYDFAGAVRRALGVPVAFDTDVNAAVLAEARWGAARGVSNCLYITVGTGIGGGAIVNGQVLRGLSHPEMGHVRIPHDRVADPYSGDCPYHADCLEGLASGAAIQARWGARAEDLPAGHPAWKLQAGYLALGIANFIYTLSPELIVIGGGVMRQTQLYEMVRREVKLILANYFERPPQIVAPGVGDLSGVLGALVLAEESKS